MATEDIVALPRRESKWEHAERIAIKPTLIVIGTLLVLLTLTAGALWFGVSHWGKYAAEYGPELPVNVVARAENADAALRNAKDPYERWLALGEVALWKSSAPTEAESRAAAMELLGLLDQYPDDWNHGNAIHRAHSALGRLALKAGDLPAARAHLLASANSKGSPQMSTFGPNMFFAREMLEAGESVAVLEYLQLCGKFWSMGQDQIAAWTRMIGEGRMPVFGANLMF